MVVEAAGEALDLARVASDQPAGFGLRGGVGDPGVAEPAADLPRQPSGRDPEEVAIELLSAQLGARAVEDRR